MEADKKYMKGLNTGYELSKSTPKLFEKILEGAEGNSTYLQGLKDGYKLYTNERNQELYKERMKHDVDQQKNFDRER